MRRYIHMSVVMVVIAAFLELWMAPLPVSAGDRQGTDGSEMNVYAAEQLEIKLGSEWAGKEFRLETDAGTYPDILKADADGVIRTELGGSTSYILTAVNNRKDASGALPVDRTETGKTPERTEAGTVKEFHSGTVSQPQVTGDEQKEDAVLIYDLPAKSTSTTHCFCHTASICGII